eukprot:gene13213-biopygen8001
MCTVRQAHPESCGGMWSRVESHGITLNHAELYGVRRNHTEAVMWSSYELIRVRSHAVLYGSVWSHVESHGIKQAARENKLRDPRVELSGGVRREARSHTRWPGCARGGI